MTASPAAKRFIIAGTVLGVGFGGFIDGILLHQVLGWHHLTSSIYTTSSPEDVRANIFWDGVFHVAMLMITTTGLLLLWRWARAGGAVWSSRAFAGTLLFGWGLFNLYDAVVDHYLLDLHRVRQDHEHEAFYDVAFLLVAIVLTAIGWWLIRTSNVGHRGVKSR